MAKAEKDKIFLPEHVLEVRYDASGTFLDVRGYVADYIRKEGFFPHWKIDSNLVNFRDEPNDVRADGAFVGYKSAGYVALNPQTRNYFTDRASSFWKLLLKNEHYNIPELKRFGARTKLFVPSPQSFDEINKMMYEMFYTEKARLLIGGTESDLQFTIDLKEEGFNVRLIAGPIHKDEAGKYFRFDSEHFCKCGLMLDIDYFKTDGLTHQSVPKLLKQAVQLTWEKAERISVSFGL